MPAKNILWIKLQFQDLLSDPKSRFVRGLNDEQKGLFLMLLLLMGYYRNSIPNDVEELKRVLNLSEKSEKIAENLDVIKRVFAGAIKDNGFIKFKNYNKLHNYVYKGNGNDSGIPKELLDKIRIDKNRIEYAFLRKYKERLNTAYVLNYGRDRKIFGDLLKNISVDQALECINKFFADTDPWLNQTDRSVPVFKSRINRYLVSQPQASGTWNEL